MPNANGKGSAKMEVISEITPEKWRQAVDRCASATIYHSYNWSKIVEASFDDCELAPRVFVFDDGREAFLPGMEFPALRGVMRRFCSVHPSTYGGLLSEHKLTQDDSSQVYDYLRSQNYAQIVIYTNPFQASPALSGFKQTKDVTYAIPLDGGFEAVWHERFSQYIRRDANRAEKKGVEVRIGTSQQDIDAMYDLYLASAKRWGNKVTWLRPRRLYENTMKAGHPKVKLRLAMLDGQAIGGAVDYYFRNFCHAGWRAFDYEYRNYYPNNLLVREAVREACELGLRYYDMGGSSGLSGVNEFKQRCGAIPLECSVETWENPMFKTYQFMKRGLLNAKTSVHGLVN